MLSAFIVVLLIGASYRGDPSAEGPAKRSVQTISFAPSAGPDDINKLNKLTSTANKTTRTSFRNRFKPSSRRARMRGLT